MFTIRPATPDDVATLVHLISRQADHLDMQDQLSVTEEALITHLFSDPVHAHALIVDDSETQQAIGCGLYYFTYSTFRGQPKLFIEDIYIKKAYRQQGAGKLIFKKLAELAQEKGCAGLVWQVPSDNESAIAVYDHLGAEQDTQFLTYQLSGEALAGLVRGGKFPPQINK